MRNCFIIFLLLFCFAGFAHAVYMPTGIEADIDASLVTEGPWTGLYLYDIDVVWNLDEGLNYFDIILKPGCAADDHQIYFEAFAGFSNGVDGEVDWEGVFMRGGDPSLDPSVTDPILRFEPMGSSPSIPDVMGDGIFWFYSNIIPEALGPYPDKVVGTTDSFPDEYGVVTGDYPSCTIIPEPATLFLFGIGGLALLRKKRTLK